MSQIMEGGGKILTTVSEPLFKFVRGMVSRDKYRFVCNGYDLDLTYITERIIGKHMCSKQ
jgi:hypothetical protein